MGEPVVGLYVDAAAPWAVTAYGRVLYFDGIEWYEKIPNVYLSKCYGMANNGKETVYYGPSGDLSCGSLGNDPKPVSQTTPYSLLGATFIPGKFVGSDYLVVGERGTIIRFSGTSWLQDEVSQTQGDLLAITGFYDWRSSLPVLYAVGAIGKSILRSSGDGQWDTVSVPTDTIRRAVWVDPANGEVYAVGNTGPGGIGGVTHFLP